MSKKKNQGKRTYICDRCQREKYEHLEIFKIWDKDGQQPDLCYYHLQDWIAGGNKPYLIKLVKDEDGFRTV